jgi:hypothetical protein
MYTEHETGGTFTLLLSVKFPYILPRVRNPPHCSAKESVMPDCCYV